ncbi:MAG TPA: lysozyme inhibitor LprI family protein [Thermoanaerobaculia bacterium]|nr:lysozyme inhibitor LprI family protein [Thermoanaerobaculia bacterium]
MQRLRCALTMLCFGFVAPVLAQTSDCREAETTRETEICAAEQQRVTSKELREALWRLAERLSPARRTALNEAQVAWEAFRAKECRFVGLEYEGGTAENFSESLCYLDLTRERMARIREVTSEMTESPQE